MAMVLGNFAGNGKEPEGGNGDRSTTASLVPNYKIRGRQWRSFFATKPATARNPKEELERHDTGEGSLPLPAKLPRTIAIVFL